MNIKNFIPALICGGLSLAMLIGGVVCTIVGNSQMKAAGQVDVDSDFLKLEDLCTISSVDHTYKTKREARSTGSDSSETVEFCEDSVTYTFAVPDGGEHVERQHVSSRGEQTAGFLAELSALPDRCQGASGFNQDLVCNGRICQQGDAVPCWKPRSCSGGCSSQLNWANCGNSACYKVIDPRIELAETHEDASVIGLFGILLFILAGGACVFGACMTACIMRSKASE
eukprot:gb/GFBE01000944.1/.p1 GENE.gb/GFBE01000944.1/~~gb/GFBE01000944.1/.p1  ORF type:complete len:227 (+),score=31.31 gb/GFBE01000944.1/:1-681(+)